MKCDDAKTLTAGLALDDLESAERLELEQHLASCADCRAAAELDRRTVSGLKSLGADEGSEVRRERAVAAMLCTHREARVPRRRWIAASIAAAVLAALAVPLLYPRGGLAVRRLDGAAWIQREGTSEFVALRVGDAIRGGDWLKTESVVGLEGPGGLKVFVNRNSRIVYDDSGATPTIHLAEGTVYVETREKELTIVDPSDRRVTVRDGRFEIRTTRVASGSGDQKSEIRVHVEKGVARVTGSGGSRDVGAGKAVQVTEGGRFSEEEEPGLIAPWRKQP